MSIPCVHEKNNIFPGILKISNLHIVYSNIMVCLLEMWIGPITLSEQILSNFVEVIRITSSMTRHKTANLAEITWLKYLEVSWTKPSHSDYPFWFNCNTVRVTAVGCISSSIIPVCQWIQLSPFHFQSITQLPSCNPVPRFSPSVKPQKGLVACAEQRLPLPAHRQRTTSTANRHLCVSQP